MNIKEEEAESRAAAAPTATHVIQPISRWRTAKERGESVRAKKQRRRAAHRIALRRPHSKG
jgi:hypothetical protein